MSGDVAQYGPTEICQFLESEQTLIDADKSAPTPADLTPTAFAAKTIKYDHLHCSNCKAKECAAFMGYTQP